MFLQHYQQSIASSVPDLLTWNLRIGRTVALTNRLVEGSLASGHLIELFEVFVQAYMHITILELNNLLQVRSPQCMLATIPDYCAGASLVIHLAFPHCRHSLNCSRLEMDWSEQEGIRDGQGVIFDVSRPIDCACREFRQLNLAKFGAELYLTIFETPDWLFQEQVC